MTKSDIDNESWRDNFTGVFETNPIAKLVYKREFFDLSVMKIGARTVTTITPDGNVVIREYRGDSRKVYSTRKTTCSADAFKYLCNQFENCIINATKWDMYVDDCAEELRIVYKFGREQKIDRGLGDENTRIATIFYEFMEKLSIE